MPDGTGDDDYGSPSLPVLKQLSWDIGYIRDKLTHGDVSKTLIWRRTGSSRHQMILGRIVVDQINFLSAFRSTAAAIQSKVDGAAPSVSDFGKSNYSSGQLLSMYESLVEIASLIVATKKTFTMRVGSKIEFTIGDVAVTNSGYRNGIVALASQL